MAALAEDVPIIISLKTSEKLRGMCPRGIKILPSKTVQQLIGRIASSSKSSDIARFAEDHRLFFRGTEISAEAHRSSKLSSLGLTHFSEVYLQAERASEVSEEFIVAYGPLIHADDQHLIDECNKGLKRLYDLSDDQRACQYDEDFPEKATGLSGTYLMPHESGGRYKKVAVLKPSDEEAGAPNNPYGSPNSYGVESGSQYKREIAARLLDKRDAVRTGRHRVPCTMSVEILDHQAYNEYFSTKAKCASGLKVGSLQQFVDGTSMDNHSDAEDVWKRLSLSEVHMMGIMDIRLLNCDRHPGNMMVTEDDEKNCRLAMIDHGHSLQTDLQIDESGWWWLRWTQPDEPFEPDTLKFISEIDIEGDISELERHLDLDERAMDNMRASHMLLALGAHRGLTLREIAEMIVRADKKSKEKSFLERAIEDAQEGVADRMAEYLKQLAQDMGVSNLKELMQMGFTEQQVLAGASVAVNKSDANEILDCIKKQSQQAELRRIEIQNLFKDSRSANEDDSKHEDEADGDGDGDIGSATAQAYEDYLLQRVLRRQCFRHYLGQELRKALPESKGCKANNNNNNK